MYKKFFKWIIDLISAILLLPALLLLSALIAIPQLILYRRIFFFQQRPGKDEQLFWLIKFQTMHDGEGTDEERVTSLGNMLRKTALDELPQIINILKGDMSFIGPRPLLIEYLPLYSSNHRHRHDVKPGITGLSQVHGPSLVSWTEKLDMDVQYTEMISWSTDWQIVLKTVSLLIKGAGQSKEQLHERFRGYE